MHLMHSGSRYRDSLSKDVWAKNRQGFILKIVLLTLHGYKRTEPHYISRLFKDAWARICKDLCYKDRLNNDVWTQNRLVPDIEILLLAAQGKIISEGKKYTFSLKLTFNPNVLFCNTHLSTIVCSRQIDKRSKQTDYQLTPRHSTSQLFLLKW